MQHMGRFDDAIDAYRQAITLQPDNSIAYGNMGFLLSDQNKMTEAQGMFEEAIKLDPGNPFFFLGLGILQVEQNNFEVAEASLCHAVENRVRLCEVLIMPPNISLWQNFNKLLINSQ